MIEEITAIPYRDYNENSTVRPDCFGNWSLIEDVEEIVASACEIYHDFPKDCHCEVVGVNPSCFVEDSFVEYIQEGLCNPRHVESDTWIIGTQIAYFIWLIYLALALGLTADGFFVPILTRISDLFGLSDEVAGVTLVALGNGAADIFAAIASFSSTDPTTAKLAVGALIGAGMFVVCVVAGGVMFMMPFVPPNWPLTRDIVCYLWAVYWLLCCLYSGRIRLYDSIGFLVFYLFYVTVVVLWSKYGPKKHKHEEIEEVKEMQLPDSAAPSSLFKNRLRSDSMRSQYGDAPVALKKKPVGASTLATSNLNAEEDKAPENDTPPPRTWGGELKRAFTPWDPVDFEGCSGKIFAILMAPCYLLVKLSVCVLDDDIETWNYPLAIIQMFASPIMFYVLLEQYEEDEFGVDDNCGLDPTSECDGFPRWAIPIIIGAAFSLVTIIFGSLEKPPFFKNVYTALGMITAMLWIACEANEIVGLLTALGVFWKIPTAIMGLTFLAWANSIGDLVADISLARLGKARTAVAACFGSPLLNILFGTGVGCLVATLTDEAKKDGVPMALGPLEMSLLFCMMGVLVVLLFILPPMKFHAGKPLGIFLIVFYLCSLVLCIYFGAIAA